MLITHRSVTRCLVIGAVIVGAFAGALVDRAVVATPAWDQLGPRAWVDYSRDTDLGNGLIIYPMYGISLAVLALAAAVSHRTDRQRPLPAGLPIYLAAFFAIGVLATTAKAAPIMLGVDDLADAPAAARDAFDQFTMWGVAIRGIFAVLAFLSSVWALARYPRPTTE
jgi:hypothetical protein